MFCESTNRGETMRKSSQQPTDELREMNRRAAREQAERMDFEPSKVLFCPGCGRTVIRSQKVGNPGFKDSLFCTCEEIGLPMIAVEPE